LRVEGSKFLPAFTLALVLIFLVLAAQFNSFRDPLIIMLGSVPLAMFGALIFSFLKMPGPNMPFFTNGWTTTLNIYSQVGLVTLIGLVSRTASSSSSSPTNSSAGPPKLQACARRR
jgi:multidrug efflux pump